MPIDYKRPAFIDEAAWEAASEAQRKDWHNYNADLAALLDDAAFRRVAWRWLEEFLHVDGALLEHEIASPGGATVLMYREGARQAGVRIREHLRMAAPKLWSRAFNEQNGARQGATQEPHQRPEE